MRFRRLQGCFIPLSCHFSFSPIPNIVENYYGVSSLQVDLLAIIFFISGFTFRFPAMWILDYVGLGFGVSLSLAGKKESSSRQLAIKPVGVGRNEGKL